MTSNPYRTVNPGDRLRIPAKTWNQLVGVAKDQAYGGDAGLGAHGAAARSLVLVRNSSGADVDRFGVLAVGDALIDPAASAPGFLERVAVDGESVTSANAGSFVVATEPIRNGAVGRAAIVGAMPLKLTINSESDQYAAAVPGASVLHTAGAGGARVIWKEAGTGAGKYAIVDLGSASASRRVLAKITGSSAMAGENNRWSYDWTEVEIADGAFSTVAGGLNSASSGLAYNLIEAGNTGSGIQGNGVDLANLPVGFSVKPIGAGAIVYLDGPHEYSDSSMNWFFHVANAVDGVCK
jgi:hypothetical protein